MRRLLAFIGGILSGTMIGTAAALLLAPASGDSMRENLRARLDHARLAGEVAAQRKRAEMEAELVAMTGPHPAGSPALRDVR